MLARESGQTFAKSFISFSTYLFRTIKRTVYICNRIEICAVHYRYILLHAKIHIYIYIFKHTIFNDYPVSSDLTTLPTLPLLTLYNIYHLYQVCHPCTKSATPVPSLSPSPPFLYQVCHPCTKSTTPVLSLPTLYIFNIYHFKQLYHLYQS